MIASKNIERIVAVIVSAAVIICILAMLFSDSLADALSGPGVTLEYETELFDTSDIIELNIIMNKDDWNDLLENAINEEYYQCDVEVNGTMFYSVGVRPKGNTSLSTIASDSTTDRYSLKIEFDYYIDGQTCFGLDKLVLNNNYADATNMKEAIIYDMFAYLDADASLYNYADISVNGETWGVYLALEAVEDSFLLRNYGAGSGELYKPDSMNFGGVGGSMGGSGADLNYIDDDVDSYSTIWDGEVGSTGTADHKRVVKALKNISEQNDIETYLDVDNMLKYMAVHTFSVNLDSLSGSMAHNYYLYEDDGQLNLIPWDYNLAFGGFQSGGNSSASKTINFAIDTPFSSGLTLEDREFFAALFENEDYLAQYHEYLSILAVEYVAGGVFDEVYTRIRGQIVTLVENDPTAFYTADEYDAAAQMLTSVVTLRAESIVGQLDGTIPSTNEGMAADSSTLIDATGINISVMGTMGVVNSGMGAGNVQSGYGATETSTKDDATTGNFTPPDRMTMPDGITMPDGSGQSGGTTSGGYSTLMLYGISLAVLAIALIIAKLYKRR